MIDGIVNLGKDLGSTEGVLGEGQSAEAGQVGTVANWRQSDQQKSRAEIITGGVSLRSEHATVIEKWEDLKALEAHLAAPHMAEYQEAVKDLVQQIRQPIAGDRETFS